MMVTKSNSRYRFLLDCPPNRSLIGILLATFLVGLPSMAVAQSASKAGQLDKPAAEAPQKRSLTAGLKNRSLVDSADTGKKRSLTAGLKKRSLTEGLKNKNAEGSDSKAKNQNGNKNKPANGSSNRNTGASSVDYSSMKKYERLPAVKLDKDLSKTALESAAKIDEMIDKGLKDSGVRPEKVTDDYEFVRRAYLDISGTIPTGRQALEFVKSRKSRGEKRTALVEQLLNSRGYVSHSFNLWAEILRLVDQGQRTAFLRPYSDWVKDSIASDMPYDHFVSQLLSATGRIWENPPVGYTLRDRDMKLANLDNSMRIFLGTRVGCAQCHDHPFDTWTQKQFYELAAFIHGTNTSDMTGPVNQAIAQARQEMDQLPKTIETAERMREWDRIIDASAISVGEVRDARLRLPKDYKYDNAKPRQVVDPQVVFGAPPSIEPGVSLRSTFSNWVTASDNPRFTQTIANRLWKRVFGVGLIEPVDNLNDATEASNQELLDFLVLEMKRVNYKQREFLRILYNTKAYQRKAFLGDLDLNEPYFFQGPALRRMTAQQLWDSMLTLTLAEPDLYERPRGDIKLKMGALDPDKQYSLSDLSEKYKAVKEYEGRDGEEAKLNKVHSHEGYLLVRASEMPQPQKPDHFIRQFGQGDRTLISGDTVEGHVPQILTMFNGPISHKLLYEGTVIYDEVASASTINDKIEVIFLSILNRPPTRLDKRLALSEIEAQGAAGVGNLIWSLLNTREFMFIQ